MGMSKWLTWEPGQIIEDSLKHEPTKPSSVSFGSSIPRESPIIRSTPTKRIANGHTVAKIEWETPNTIVFRDPEGKLWRRVHRWKMAWPITIEGGD